MLTENTGTVADIEVRPAELIATEIDRFNAAAHKIAAQLRVATVDVTPASREAGDGNAMLVADRGAPGLFGQQDPVAIDWSSLSAAQNRIAMQARIEVGEMEGFLAFAGGDALAMLREAWRPVE